MRVHLPISSIDQNERREFDISVPEGSTNLAALLWGRGHLPPRPLCAGIGHCGLCRVRFLSSPPAPTSRERDMLDQEEISSGLRLACCHDAENSMELSILPLPGEYLLSEEKTPLPEKSKNVLPVWLAVDLGTTSLVWEALDEEGNVQAEGRQLNPQMGAGTDVMARLAAASTESGAAFMRDSVRNALAGIISGLTSQNMQVRELCLAANPAMTLLALGLDSSGLRSAPYTLNFHGDEYVNLPGFPPLWIPPLPAPFVGGDLSAGLCAVLHSGHRLPLLLADMGTNGEFALLRAGKPPLLASVPLGPALEGIGLRCGGMAGNGAVTAFHASPSGLLPHVIGNTRPHHICGAGYLSLIQLLLSLGLLDADGHFHPENKRPHPLAFLRARLAASLDSKEGEPVLRLPDGLFLAASDVENLLKVKAAFSLAVESLLAAADLTSADLEEIVLAGALGVHAPLEALGRLGFLPPLSESKTRAAGNTSLQGAAFLLRGHDGIGPDALRAELSDLCRNAQALPLAESPSFHEQYVRHMRFDQPVLPRA